MNRSFIIAISIVFFSTIVPSVSHSYFFYIPKDNEVLSRIGTGKQELLDSNQINLLVWNIYKGAKKNFIQDFNLLSQNKDIIIIQEAVLNNKLKDMFTSNKQHEHFFATAFMFSNEKIPAGLLTSASVNSQSSQFLRSTYREPIVSTPKLALFTKYKLTNNEKLLLVINIHGINFVSYTAWRNQIINIINKIEVQNGPIIFAGDFNTWSTRRISFLTYSLKKLNFKNVKFKNDVRTTFFNIPLDHIFLRGLNYSNAKVWGGINSSDHKALTVTITN